MKAVTAKRLAEHITVAAPVSTWSTVRVRENTYSVPSRLIGQTVQARVFEDRADRRSEHVHLLNLPATFTVLAAPDRPEPRLDRA